MYNSISISPLQGTMETGQFLNAQGEQGLELSEVAIASMVQVNCWRNMSGAFLETVKKLGLNACLMNTAPDTYLVVSFEKDMVKELKEILGEDVAVITDLSHSRTCFSVKGKGAVSLLQKGLAIDLSLVAFPEREAKQSSIAHMGVTCYRQSEDEFQLFVFRGFAVSFFEWLTHNAKDIGYRIT